MANEKCGCGEEHRGSCAGCRLDDLFSYWCQSCQRAVPEKRCPYCGLKAQKRKEE